MDRRIEAVLTTIAVDRTCSVQELALSVNLSVSRLRHVFRQETGIPLGVFVRKSRLESGRVLLDGSFLSVKQVAFETGFNDETHFIREFRKAYGTAPGLYRRLQVSSTNLSGQQKKPINSQKRQQLFLEVNRSSD